MIETGKEEVVDWIKEPVPTSEIEVQTIEKETAESETMAAVEIIEAEMQTNIASLKDSSSNTELEVEVVVPKIEVEKVLVISMETQTDVLEKRDMFIQTLRVKIPQRTVGFQADLLKEEPKVMRTREIQATELMTN